MRVVAFDQLAIFVVTATEEFEYPWREALGEHELFERSRDLGAGRWALSWTQGGPAAVRANDVWGGAGDALELYHEGVTPQPRMLVTADEALIGPYLSPDDVIAWVGTFREAWRRRAYGLQLRWPGLRTVFGDAPYGIVEVRDQLQPDAARVRRGVVGDFGRPAQEQLVAGIRIGGLNPIQGIAHRIEHTGRVEVHHHRVRYLQPIHRQNLLRVSTAGSYDFDQASGAVRALGEGVERYLCGIPNSPTFGFGELPHDAMRIVPSDVYGPTADVVEVPETNSAGRYFLDVTGTVFVHQSLAIYPALHDPQCPSIRPATSNGVAVRNSLHDAMVYAERELFERHCFLWYWYSHVAPGVVDPSTEGCDEVYALIADFEDMGLQASFREFESISPTGLMVENQDLSVVGCFLSDGRSLRALGLAAGTRAHAIRAATLETVDGLVRRITPIEDPKHVDGILGHRALYQSRTHHAAIETWLAGEQELPEQATSIRPTTFVELGRVDGLTGVRAINPDLIPLCFGNGSAPVGRADVADLVARSPDPQRSLAPHPLA